MKPGCQSPWWFWNGCEVRENLRELETSFHLHLRGVFRVSITEPWIQTWDGWSWRYDKYLVSFGGGGKRQSLFLSNSPPQGYKNLGWWFQEKQPRAPPGLRYASKVWIKRDGPMTLSSSFLPASLGSRGGHTQDDLDENNFCYKFWDRVRSQANIFKSSTFRDKTIITQF